MGDRINSMDNVSREEVRDFWGKLEAWAKFLGGLGALVGSVLIPLFLAFQNQNNLKESERNRRAQIYAQIMSQREAKDTEIRARMFETLLSNYFKSGPLGENLAQLGRGSGAPGQDVGSAAPLALRIQDLRGKIVFLGLLMENFQEYFSARHLFKDLYLKIKAEEANVQFRPYAQELTQLEVDLLKLAKRTASKQVAMLSRVGLASEDVAVRERCESSELIPLFPVEQAGNVTGLISRLSDPRLNRNCEPGPSDTLGAWKLERFTRPAPARSDSTQPLYAISIMAKKIDFPEVEVSVSLFSSKNSGEEGSGEHVFFPVKSKPFRFSVSFFDMPYMDNTRLFEGNRFAIILKSICDRERAGRDKACVIKEHFPYAIFQVVIFKEEFMSLRDRPLFEEMLRKLEGASP